MAAVRKNAGRQEVLSAYVDINWDDLEDTDGVYGAIDLPPGATVIGGDVVVSTAFDNGTSADLDLGDSADDNRYTASSVDLTAAARTALTLTGYKHTGSTKELAVKVAFVGTASTEGSLRVRVDYVVDGRSFFAQS